MEERGVSQSELARRVGVTQTTISKLVIGGGYGSKYLHRIARELGTTPAYLTGETDDPERETPASEPLDSETREHLENLRILPDADRRAVLHLARSIAARIGEHRPAHLTVYAPTMSYRAEPAVFLPSEAALAQMFEGLLAGIDPTATVGEQALLLARRLPIGLSQLQDLLPGPPASAPQRRARAGNDVNPATQRPEQPQ